MAPWFPGSLMHHHLLSSRGDCLGSRLGGNRQARWWDLSVRSEVGSTEFLPMGNPVVMFACCKQCQAKNMEKIGFLT